LSSNAEELTRSSPAWLDGQPRRCLMEERERQSVQDAVSAMARIALYVVDELEPNNSDVLEQDLDDAYGLLVAAEKKARAAGLLRDE